MNATATDSEVLRDVAGEGTDFSSEDEAHTNPVVSCEEHFCSVSGASESSSDLTFIQQESILQSMVNDVGDAFPDLIFAMATRGEQPLLQISQRQLHSHPPFGMISRAQVTVQYNFYTAYVMMKKWESGILVSSEDLITVCLKISAKSEFKFCPGINPEQYETEYYAAIRFHIRSVHKTEFPFSRVDSMNCLLWFKLALNARASEKDSAEVRCKYCKRLVLDLECQKRRTISESPSRKVK